MLTEVCHTSFQQTPYVVATGGCSALQEATGATSLDALFSFHYLMPSSCPAILKTVDGAIESTGNAYVNQIKVDLVEEY